MQLISLAPGAALCLAGAATMMIGAALVIFAMIGEVNRQVPDAERVPYLLGYPGKLKKVRQAYKRLYPAGRLAVVLNILEVLAVIMVAACAWVNESSLRHP